MLTGGAEPPESLSAELGAWLVGWQSRCCLKSGPLSSTGLLVSSNANSSQPTAEAGSQGRKAAANRPIVQRKIPTKTTRSQEETKEYIFFLNSFVISDVQGVSVALTVGWKFPRGEAMWWRDARLTLAANLQDRLIASVELLSRVLPFLHAPGCFFLLIRAPYLQIFYSVKFYI